MSGAVAKNPQRFTQRKSEPKPLAPIGTAPKHLTPSERTIWKEIVTCAPAGALGSSDRIILEIVCKLTHAFRTGVLCRASEVAQLMNGLGRLGLSPADRAKLNVEPDPPNNPADDPLGFLN
jgi:phage terminase small subunit